MKIAKYLAESPVFALNSAYEKIVTSVNQELRKEGVNLLQGLVLTALAFEEEREVSPSDLALTFRTSRGNISHAVSKLEAEGWLRRRVNAQDARRFHLELKPEGRKLAYRLVRFYDRLQEFFEEELGVTQCRKAAGSLSDLAEAYEKFGK